jgi:hypothetical protein
LRTSQRNPAARACVPRHAAVNDQVGVETSETEVVHAHHQASCTTAGGHPPPGVCSHRVVHDEDVRCKRSKQPGWTTVYHVTPERQSRLFHGDAASQCDERAHAKCTRQRAAAHEMTEATPRTGRRAKQNSKISAGRHDRLR